MPHKDKNARNQYEKERRLKFIQAGLCERDGNPLAIVNGKILTLCEVCREKKRVLETKPKKIVIEHYGQSCQMCNENILEFLTIDHIDGGGNLHRKEIGKIGHHFYKWLIKNGFPNEYQVLCFNCNCGRKIQISDKNKSRKMKLEIANVIVVEKTMKVV